MSSILRMEFYITRKSKIWLNIALVGTGFFFLATFIVHNSIDQRMQQAMGLLDPSQSMELAGLPFLSYWERLISSDAITMFTSIFAIMFMLVEFQNGYIKNIWTSIEKKGSFLLSKYTVLLTFIIFMFVVNGIVIGISNFMYLGCTEFGDIYPFMKYCATQILLHFAFCCTVMCIALLAKQRTVVMIASIIYVAFAPQMIYSAINQLVIKVLPASENFLIQKYLPYGNVIQLSTQSDSGEYLRAIIVGLVFIIGTSIVSMLALKKYDI